MEGRTETERRTGGSAGPGRNPGGSGGRVGGFGRGLPGLAALLLAPALLLWVAPAAAQDVDEEGLGGPPLAEAPDQFRVAVSGSYLDWEEPEASGGQEIDGATAWGVDLATRVAPFLAFRFGGAVGGTEITGTDTDGARRTVDATQWLFEVAAVPRLAFGPLRDAGVVPFGVAGVGSVIHDPRTEEGEFEPPLVTRSQGALILGGGLEVEPDALGAFGARVEWRRAEVQLQNLFVSTDREGVGRGSNRFTGTLFLSF